MNDDLKKKISEQEELISFLSKENKLLKSENDSLIKQNKINIDIIENLHRRIDNFIPGNTSKHSINELQPLNIDNLPPRLQLIV